MWLMSKLGFYSIVQKSPGLWQIRSRNRVDLDNLKKAANLACPVVLSPANDYPMRLVVGIEGLRAVMGTLTASIDYPNFKSEIKESKHGQKRKTSAYMQVWGVMRGVEDSDRSGKLSRFHH
jgi:hypothetical protein